MARELSAWVSLAPVRWELKEGPCGDSGSLFTGWDVTIVGLLKLPPLPRVTCSEEGQLGSRGGVEQMAFQNQKRWACTTSFPMLSSA
jgi:hypothetical protein